ncbi:NYN domain-containing protein [Albidovulum sp.]|uniref:NYN domain-containing protein n=1 Tax=Albidovulum sp. TaxID=1872424 RepID=UPI0039B9C5FB
MVAPFLLLVLSLAGVVAALFMQGMSGAILIAGPSALASLFLLLRAYLRDRAGVRKASRKLIVIDGSNAMHWKDGTPQLATLREIVQRLSALGFTAGVVFDANAGHILTGRYQHNAAMGKLLGLPEDRVIVVNKGEPADPTVLAAARFLKARIVTNDRYRDWADAFPEMREPGYLIRGGYRAGKLWLEVDAREN